MADGNVHLPFFQIPAHPFKLVQLHPAVRLVLLVRTGKMSKDTFHLQMRKSGDLRDTVRFILSHLKTDAGHPRIHSNMDFRPLSCLCGSLFQGLRLIQAVNSLGDLIPDQFRILRRGNVAQDQDRTGNPALSQFHRFLQGRNRKIVHPGLQILSHPAGSVPVGIRLDHRQQLHAGSQTFPHFINIMADGRQRNLRIAA